MFGDLQESLVSACREALDTAAQEKDRTIVFWMNGFAAVSSEWKVIILEMITTYDHYIWSLDNFTFTSICEPRPPLLQLYLVAMLMSVYLLSVSISPPPLPSLITTYDHYLWSLHMILHMITTCDHYISSLHMITTYDYYVWSLHMITTYHYIWSLHITTCDHYIWSHDHYIWSLDNFTFAKHLWAPPILSGISVVLHFECVAT